MSVTCFFCQNLLSDYIEKCLSSARHAQVEEHIKDCQLCKKTRDDLKLTQKLMHKLPLQATTHEMVLRIMEASKGRKKSIFANPRVRTMIVGLVMPLLVLGILVSAFPNRFSWAWSWRQPTTTSQFVRYYPLFQGASEILDEQTAFLSTTESVAGSLWEEGGLAPEDFEKAFRKKITKE